MPADRSAPTPAARGDGESRVCSPLGPYWSRPVEKASNSRDEGGDIEPDRSLQSFCLQRPPAALTVVCGIVSLE
ncbi:hypothetical protein NN561_016948 [Cricetulus griseus]